MSRTVLVVSNQFLTRLQNSIEVHTTYLLTPDLAVKATLLNTSIINLKNATTGYYKTQEETYQHKINVIAKGNNTKS